MKHYSVALIGPLSAAAALLTGCGAVIIDQKGDVNASTLSMLFVIVPVIVTTVLVAWKSRALYSGGLLGFSVAYLSCVLLILLVDFFRAYGGT